MKEMLFKDIEHITEDMSLYYENLLHADMALWILREMDDYPFYFNLQLVNKTLTIKAIDPGIGIRAVFIDKMLTRLSRTLDEMSDKYPEFRQEIVKESDDLISSIYSLRKYYNAPSKS
ncbi:hypothetical protein EMF73_32330 [Klebsiella pneumoniae]|nr:hypothetical protein EMF73_32330 [Klebsiella pneumoniae]